MFKQNLKQCVQTSTIILHKVSIDISLIHKLNPNNENIICNNINNTHIIGTYFNDKIQFTLTFTYITFHIIFFLNKSIVLKINLFLLLSFVGIDTLNH